jgi:hypothetical protein
MKSKYTLVDAEEAIRRRLAKDNFQGELKYDARKVKETDSWWYIPYTWIGCSGMIVNKSDLYVNWLGSALSVEECFWGHEHGIYSDLVDFTFALNTSRELAIKIISRFQHLKPDSKGRLPKGPVWYRDSEIEQVLQTDFPTFRRHFVWYGIPELKHAWDQEGLRFTSTLSKLQ